MQFFDSMQMGFCYLRSYSSKLLVILLELNVVSKSSHNTLERDNIILNQDLLLLFIYLLISHAGRKIHKNSQSRGLKWPKVSKKKT